MIPFDFIDLGNLDGSDDHVSCPTCRGYGGWMSYEMCSRCAGSCYIHVDDLTPEEVIDIELDRLLSLPSEWDKGDERYPEEPFPESDDDHTDGED